MNYTNYDDELRTQSIRDNKKLKKSIKDRYKDKERELHKKRNQDRALKYMLND